MTDDALQKRKQGKSRPTSDQSETSQWARNLVEQLSPAEWLQAYQDMSGSSYVLALRCKRAMKAARLLICKGLSLAQVIKQMGYEDREQMDRAFRDVFGLSAQAYRDRGRLNPPRNRTIDTLYDVSLSQHSRKRVAALAQHGCYHQAGDAFDLLYGLISYRGLSYNALRRVSYLHDDTFSLPPEALSSHVCVEVGTDFKGDEILQTFDIEGGAHATLSHFGPYFELEKAYFWLTRWWLPQRGLKARAAPFFTSYMNRNIGIPPSQWHAVISVPIDVDSYSSLETAPN